MMCFGTANKKPITPEVIKKITGNDIVKMTKEKDVIALATDEIIKVISKYAITYRQIPNLLESVKSQVEDTAIFKYETH